MNAQFFPPWATLKLYGHGTHMDPHRSNGYFRMGKNGSVILRPGHCARLHPFASSGFGNNNFCFVIIQWEKVLHKQKPPPPQLLLRPVCACTKDPSAQQRKRQLLHHLTNLILCRICSYLYSILGEGVSRGGRKASFKFNTDTREHIEQRKIYNRMSPP